MIKMKTLVLVLMTVLFAGATFAQSVDDGKKFLYYERYKSAKDVFQKLSSANPNDETAAYYLGQSMIGLEDVAGAKALYQQKLSANPNSPLILAGIGQIELMEGKNADARNRFETAISLSSGKRIDVLNAVGAANSNPERKNGDAAYAVDKLKQATQLKGFKDPEVLVNLGDAYRKLGDGGSAIQSYDAALALNPNYARAIYRKGGIYQSQGDVQKALFTQLYDQAIAKDPAYAPVYSALFNYYYETDVPKAAGYLEKLLANSDDDPKACYYRASIKYAQGLFSDAVAQANQCISAEGATVYPNLYGVKALAYNRLGDSVNAKASYEEYFKRQSADKIGAGDYSSYASILLKFPGNEQIASEYVTKAVALDSLEAHKVTYQKEIAAAFQAQKKYDESAKWYAAVVNTKKNPTNLDLYNAGYDYYRAGKMDSSIVYFKKYEAKYPDDIFGYYMEAKSVQGIDSTWATGAAEAAYKKAVEVGEKATDPAKAKNYLIASYKSLIEYYYNVKKDQATALSYADKALALDPADQSLIQNRDVISKTDPRAAPRPPARPATPGRATTTPPATPKTPAPPKKK